MNIHVRAASTEYISPPNIGRANLPRPRAHPARLHFSHSRTTRTRTRDVDLPRLAQQFARQRRRRLGGRGEEIRARLGAASPRAWLANPTSVSSVARARKKSADAAIFPLGDIRARVYTERAVRKRSGGGGGAR